jgi:hypothetical protein
MLIVYARSKGHLFQNEANAMGVDPFLPDVGVQADDRLPKR